jgi:hypothetical protein
MYFPAGSRWRVKALLASIFYPSLLSASEQPTSCLPLDMTIQPPACGGLLRNFDSTESVLQTLQLRIFTT